MNKRGKRGQVAIFIIVGIVIVALIAGFFIFRDKLPDLAPKKTAEFNINSELEQCLKKNVYSVVELISHQGGYLSNPLNKTFKFENEKKSYDISYLCYTRSFYNPCITQQPLLIQHIQDEIKNYIQKDVKNCFDDAATNLEGKGYNPSVDYNGFDVVLSSGKIEINIDGKITTIFAGEKKINENFNLNIPSSVYDLSRIAQEISSQESKYCNFEYVGYMSLYPQYNIDYFRTSDAVKIYTIKDKKTEDWFRFAIRGCVIAPSL